MKNTKLLLDTIKKQIDCAQVISFDIFDTLLVRPYVRPIDVFAHIEKALNKSGFTAERRDAERRARLRHPELEDITIEMIYDEIDDEYKDLKQKEMDWEAMVLRANPELKQVYDYAVAKGKRIIITSDMYLPAEFLAKVLRKNGYGGWEKLYVSGDVQKCKGSGSLFSWLLQDVGVKADKVLHIGDSKTCDYDVPQRLGVQPVRYISLMEQFKSCDIRNKALLKQLPNRLDVSILMGVLAYRWMEKKVKPQQTSYWFELGHNYAGPLSYGYTRFLEQQAANQLIDHLLFVARDGYTLQKVFKVFNTTLKNDYVYANGALRRITSLECKQNSVFGKYIVDYYASLSPEIMTEVEQAVLRTPEDYETFISNNYPLFEPQHQQFRNNYKNYLGNIISQKEKLLVVDTMARTFASLALISDFVGEPVLGAYFTFIKEPFSKNFQFCSYAQTVYGDNTVFEKKNINLFTKNWDFMEFLLSSPEQPIKQIDENGHPVYEDTDNEYKLRRAEIYPLISEGAVTFAKEIQSWFKGYDIFLQFDTIIQWINIFMDVPTAEGIKAMSQIRFFHGVGDDRCDPLFAMKLPFKQIILHPVDSFKKVKSLKWKNTLQCFVCYGIYCKIQRVDETVTKLFGCPISSKITKDNKVKKKKLFGLWKVVKNYNTNKKAYYLFGVRILRCRMTKGTANSELSEAVIRRIVDRTSLNVQRSLTIAFLHQKTFGEFRNCNCGKKVVLVGCGPSVNQFVPIQDAKYIGLNRAFLYDKVHFNYLLTIDKHGLDVGNENYWPGFLDYDCVKFVGDQNLGRDFQIPQPYMYADSRVRRYKTSANHLPGAFVVDLDTEALANSTSCSLQGAQFALFTNPKQLYIVGIDCTVSSLSHFIGSAYDTRARNESAAYCDASQIAAWKRLKIFVETYYPDTEIISVNPVGLKGIFHDVYTRPYLEEHPEIDATKVEILEENPQGNAQEI